MPFGCWISVLLLLLPAETRTQSGDGDSDAESRISCSSHITTKGSSLTCELVGGGNDSEDDEDDDDSIERITLCCTDWSGSRKCLEELGDTISSAELNPLPHYNLTVHLKGGRTRTATVDLQKIVKPRSPHVWNVTFSRESNQAVFHIRTPYSNDFLKVKNQLFQLHIWTADKDTPPQNVSKSDTMHVDMEHLLKNSRYHVRVRSIPVEHLQGSWSEWGETFSFSTPAEENNIFSEEEEEVDRVRTTDVRKQETIYRLIVCLVSLVIVTSSVVFFWKNKIFTYMWPNIPHPKHTLVQICKPNKGLLLNFKPEVFSALKISPMERASCEEAEPSLRPAAADGTNTPSSTQSSDCSTSNTSVSTEELELLSRSSSDREDSLQSAGPSSVDVLRLAEGTHAPAPERSAGQNEPEVFAVSQQEEAYVTMSSFFQIN